MNGVTKETFLQVKGDARWGLLYDILEGIHGTCVTCREEMVPRVKKLENNKNKDTAAAVAGGFIGGFAAMAARLIFWK